MYMNPLRMNVYFDCNYQVDPVDSVSTSCSFCDRTIRIKYKNEPDERVLVVAICSFNCAKEHMRFLHKMIEYRDFFRQMKWE